MKKIMLTATALVFTVAMFAQTTGSAPEPAKTTSKPGMAQDAAKSSGEKKEAKSEKKKTHSKKGAHHAGKAQPQK